MVADPVANPFRPGAGRRPPLLAGRESLLGAFEVIQQRAETLGEGDRCWILNGLRGVGKTEYPYFLQSIGKHVWDNARRSPIQIDDVETRLREARREIDDGLYRWR